MLAMLAFYLIWNWGNAWWTNHQLDATYGMPRTWQTDEVVGHGDSADHPTHFIFLNLNGHVLIIELPGGDSAHAKIYSGPQIFSDNPSSVPVTGEFKDVGNGKIDMIVHIGDQRIVYLNTGTDFKPEQEEERMHQVDEKPETIHLYVVREEAARPSILPVVLSLFSLALLIVLGIAIPCKQPEQRASIRVPAVLLPLTTFSASEAIIPTGIKTYPATTAHGTLTITNGSVISQDIPAGFMIDGVVTDRAVLVPPGSANGYGYATVVAHTLASGKQGNLPALAINVVEGSSVYIRNLSPFTGGADSYSVKVVTPQDKQIAVDAARASLTNQEAHRQAVLARPCAESTRVSDAVVLLSWACQYVTFSIPPSMKVISVKLVGNTLLVGVVFVARPLRIWVK